jgi:hypothetical protein
MMEEKCELQKCEFRVPMIIKRKKKKRKKQKRDISEFIRENLERNDGTMDFTLLDDVFEEEEDVVALVNEMAGKLSCKGIYNLCRSTKDMTIEQRLRYLDIFCTHLLLPKVRIPIGASSNLPEISLPRTLIIVGVAFADGPTRGAVSSVVIRYRRMRQSISG